jgi:hypothetical protein
MSIKSVTVDVEVYLDQFDDEVLVEELEARGYNIDKEEGGYLHEVVDWYKRGNVKEALIQLERLEPELYGISEKVK